MIQHEKNTFRLPENVCRSVATEEFMRNQLVRAESEENRAIC